MVPLLLWTGGGGAGAGAGAGAGCAQIGCLTSAPQCINEEGIFTTFISLKGNIFLATVHSCRFFECRKLNT